MIRLFDFFFGFQAMVSAKRGQKYFPNDQQFHVWSHKCSQVILNQLHNSVFDDFGIRLRMILIQCFKFKSI